MQKAEFCTDQRDISQNISLKFDPTDPNQGIFFINGTATRVEVEIAGTAARG